MVTYGSGAASIRMDALEAAGPEKKPALLLLHGSGGAVSYWLGRFAPAIRQFGMGVYAPHYFDKTGTERASAATILDGRHFPAWLAAIDDAMSYLAGRPTVDADRIGVLGVSLGGYLAVALAAGNRRIRAAVELSGGLPPGSAGQLSPSMAPVLVLHGDRDTVVPVSEAFRLRDALVEHRVPHQIEIFPGETHWFSPAAQPRLLLSCADFLSRHLSAPPG